MTVFAIMVRMYKEVLFADAKATCTSLYDQYPARLIRIYVV